MEILSSSIGKEKQSLRNSTIANNVAANVSLNDFSGKKSRTDQTLQMAQSMALKHIPLNKINNSSLMATT